MARRSGSKRGLLQHGHEQLQTAVEVLGEQVEVDRAGGVADRRGELRGQEVQLLVERLGVQLAGAAAAPHRARQAGDTLLAGGLEIPTAPELHLDAHQRQHAVLGQVDRHAVGEHGAHGAGIGYLPVQAGYVSCSGRAGIWATATAARHRTHTNARNARRIVSSPFRPGAAREASRHPGSQNPALPGAPGSS